MRSTVAAGVIAAGVAFIGAGAAPAASAPKLRFISPPTALKFAAAKGKSYQSAHLHLLLENTAVRGGTLEVRFFPGDGGTLAPVPGGATLPALVLVAPAPGTRVAARSVTALSLELRRATRAKKPSSGALVVRLRGDAPQGPAVLELTEQAAPTTAGTPKLRFEQKDATLTVTRWLGFLSHPTKRACGCDWTSGTSLVIGTRGKTPAEKSTILNSDSGRHLKLTLERRDGSSSTLGASHFSGHGKYAGNLMLDPDAKKPRTLAVTVHVRDAVIWPLFAVLCGAVIGVVLIRKNDIRRGRNLTQKAIKEAIDPYLRARARNAHRSPETRDPDERYYLNDLLRGDIDKSPYYAHGACNGDDLPEVPRLYCRTHEIETNEDITAVAAEIKETTAQFDRWLRVETAARAVKRSLGRLPDESPMQIDATQLLLRTREPVNDDTEAADLVTVLRAEAHFATLYRHLRHQYDRQNDNWQQTHKKMDPNCEVKELAAKASRTRKAADIEPAFYKLLAKAEIMRHPAHAPKDRHKAHRDLTAYVVVEHNIPNLHELRADLPREVREELDDASRAAPPTPDTRSPQLIYAQVRRADWVTFWTAAALTALVYLSTVYKGEWGSLEDYLFALAAGAVGPSAVNWALLPFTRSYNPLTGKLAAAETPPPAAP